MNTTTRTKFDPRKFGGLDYTSGPQKGNGVGAQTGECGKKNGAVGPSLTNAPPSLQTRQAAFAGPGAIGKKPSISERLGSPLVAVKHWFQELPNNTRRNHRDVLSNRNNDRTID
jgi:hypothetical protein